jgi:hypothetical protein
MVSPLYWFFFYDSGKQIVYDVRHVAQGRSLRHLLAGTRNMPSQKGKRAKGAQMTEQQPKTPQIIDIVEMPPSYLIGQSFCVSIGQLFMKWRFLIGSFSSILIGG